MISTKKIIERYESFFTYEQLKDTEVQDKIMVWTDRDIDWKYDQINQALRNIKEEVFNRKVIRDFVGSCSQLKRILSLRKK